MWAWGDDGRGSVVVNLPQGFGSSIDGSPMSKTSTGGKETLRAKPDKPEEFFAILSAENPLAYTQDRLSLEGGVEIVVMAWPEDTRWDDTVSATLRTALPDLRALIGLDWPVTHDLNVRERYTPALEGYAGVFFTESRAHRRQRGPRCRNDRPRGIARVVQRFPVRGPLDLRGPRPGVRLAGAAGGGR